MTGLRGGAASLALALAALLPAAAVAQAPDRGPVAGPWRYGVSVYGYLPSLGGSSSLPTNGGGSIQVDSDQILGKLKFAFMGSIDAHNGRWGVFTDYMYLRLGDDRQGSRDFTIGRSGLAANTSASLDSEFKGTIWTLAGQYRLRADPALTVDALAGFRMASLKQSLRYSISGDIGNLPLADRSGAAEVGTTVWDGVVGVKGLYALGTSQRWFVPFYLDVGTGESKLTWQAAAGITYAFSWGELTAMWRYLAYEMKSGKPMHDVNFNGPMVGATFRF